jgi:AcrR family transcriptional regulator
MTVPRDRRVRRTKNLLHRALATLIHEKPYEDIVVKEILARADVGRSTFYTHFRDKEELLSSGLRDVLNADVVASGSEPSHRTDDVLGFSRILLEHVAQFQRESPAPRTGTRFVGLHERLRPVLVEIVSEELKRHPQHGLTRTSIPRDLLAAHVVETFLLVLSWWVEHEDEYTAAEADAFFRSLVRPP